MVSWSYIHTYREQGRLSGTGPSTMLTLAYSWEGKLYELYNNSQILYPIQTCSCGYQLSMAMNTDPPLLQNFNCRWGGNSVSPKWAYFELLTLQYKPETNSIPSPILLAFPPISLPQTVLNGTKVSLNHLPLDWTLHSTKDW